MYGGIFVCGCRNKSSDVSVKHGVIYQCLFVNTLQFFAEEALPVPTLASDRNKIPSSFVLLVIFMDKRLYYGVFVS